jgi:hypothetical protein
MKIIKFIPFGGRKKLMPPSVSKIPQWWRDGELVLSQGEPGLKSCVPFMEVMMSGYTINLPFDLFVSKNEEGNTSIKWNAPGHNGWPNFIEERPKELGETIPRPAGHLPNGFIWAGQWSWKTPKGYSALVTHPFNRFDLPFTTLSATMDADKFYGNGNVPFFLKEDFQGVIPAGTPIIQIFPYKRDKWKSWVDDSELERINEKQLINLRTPEGSYKKRFWVKKVYE